MTKILLVEDDKSLQEIYGVRLGSEGYSVLIAGDGEEALNVALKEKPDLILSDVMMPKISGFDMLDILRTTPEIKDTKVIIMTALSSEDQRERGEKLGADVYLVKSQVGIEDVVQTVKDLLEGKTEADQIKETEAAISEVSQYENGDRPFVSEPTEADFQNATVEFKNSSILRSQDNSVDSINMKLEQPQSIKTEQQPTSAVPQPLPTAPVTPQFSNSEIDEAIITNGESLHRAAPAANSQPSDFSVNPQYRQPTSLRDLIPERDQTNGQ